MKKNTLDGIYSKSSKISREGQGKDANKWGKVYQRWVFLRLCCFCSAKTKRSKNGTKIMNVGMALSQHSFKIETPYQNEYIEYQHMFDMI